MGRDSLNWSMISAKSHRCFRPDLQNSVSAHSGPLETFFKATLTFWTCLDTSYDASFRFHARENACKARGSRAGEDLRAWTGDCCSILRQQALTGTSLQSATSRGEKTWRRRRRRKPAVGKFSSRSTGVNTVIEHLIVSLLGDTNLPFRFSFFIGSYEKLQCSASLFVTSAMFCLLMVWKFLLPI